MKWNIVHHYSHDGLVHVRWCGGRSNLILFFYSRYKRVELILKDLKFRKIQLVFSEFYDVKLEKAVENEINYCLYHSQFLTFDEITGNGAAIFLLNVIFCCIISHLVA